LASKGISEDAYLADDPGEAAVLLDKAIAGCITDDVYEIRGLGDTLKRWREKILNHHRTGASNGPTEGMNLCVKMVKRGLVRGSLTPVSGDQAATVLRSAKASSNSAGVRRPSAR
jgi:hypothetical protein